MQSVNNVQSQKLMSEAKLTAYRIKILLQLIE